MNSRQVNEVFQVIKTSLAILVAMVCAFVFIFLISNEPLTAIRAFLLGPFSSIRRFGNMIEFFIPVCFTALGACVIFSIGQCSVIGEGTAFFGGLVAAWVAIQTGRGGIGTQVLAFLAAALVCGLIAMIPMYLKLRFGADLFVDSLMMNYVLLYVGIFILNYSIRDPEIGMTASYSIPEGAGLPVLIPKTQVNFALVLALLTIVGTVLLMDKTRLGYQMRLIGSNSQFAKYCGIPIGKVCMLSALVGGILSGIGGAAEMLGRYERFQWLGLPGFGWDGILIATIAGFKARNVLIAAMFIAYIRTGADIMNRTSDVPSELIIIIQSLLILMIASRGFMAKIHQKLIVRHVKSNTSEV